MRIDHAKRYHDSNSINYTWNIGEHLYNTLYIYDKVWLNDKKVRYYLKGKGDSIMFCYGIVLN